MTRSTRALLLGLALSFDVLCARGITLPLTRRATAPHSTSLNVTAASGGTDPFGFVNKADLYAATIYVQGQPFVVSGAVG